LELYLKHLLLDDSWDVYLDFQEKHVVARNRLTNFKKGFFSSTLKVVYKKTARIPIVFSVVKNFELDKGGLPSLDCGVVLILWAVILFRYMLNMCQVFDCRASLRTEHA